MHAPIAKRALHKPAAFKNIPNMLARGDGYCLPERESWSPADRLWHSFLWQTVCFTVIDSLARASKQVAGSLYSPCIMRPQWRAVDQRLAGWWIWFQDQHGVPIPQLPPLFSKQLRRDYQPRPHVRKLFPRHDCKDAIARSDVQKTHEPCHSRKQKHTHTWFCMVLNRTLSKPRNRW